MLFNKLILRNLLRHPLRSLLTVGSLTIAVFLLCTLRSVETTLNAVTELNSQHVVGIVAQSVVPNCQVRRCGLALLAITTQGFEPVILDPTFIK